MIAYTFRMKPTLIEQLKEKAGDVPVSRIIRRLIEKYVRGEVKLD